MTEHDSLHERGRALEEEYFRKKNRELVEKMQLEASRDEARRSMGAQLGLNDPETLEQLQKLGQLKSDPDTVVAQGSDWQFLNELKRELKA